MIHNANSTIQYSAVQCKGHGAQVCKLIGSTPYQYPGWTREGMPWSAVVSDRKPLPSIPPPACSAQSEWPTEVQSPATADSKVCIRDRY